MRIAGSLFFLFAAVVSCGGGTSGAPVVPAAPPSPPRQLAGIEPFAPRTGIRVGQRVGPLVAYGKYDDGTSGIVNAVWSSENPEVVVIDEEGFAVAIGVGTVTVVAAFEGWEASLEFFVEDPTPRSVKDRPDDIGGPQIHFVYAVPSDIEDRNRDRYGEVERSALAIQAWLAAETGQILRLDTFEGRPDVSFLGLPFTHQEGDGTGSALVQRILEEASRLEITGDKTLAIYYEGRVTGLCGSAPLGGPAGAVYLACSGAELGADEETISTFEAIMVHELIHAFGAVPGCAPHHIEGSHVTDVENDVMFAGVDRAPRGGETFVDVGRDDYWGHGRMDCLDVARSRFLKPASGAALSQSVEVRIPAADWPLRCGTAH